MKKHPEITAITRATFISAFIELSELKSIEKITIQELSNKAGYNRTTFYEYFTDIYNLLYSIEDDMIDCIKDNILSHAGTLRTGEDFINAFACLYHEYDRPLRLLFNEQNAPHFSYKLKKQLIPAFMEKLQLPMDDVKSVYYLDFYLSGIISAISRWFSTKDDISLESFANIIHCIVLGMIKSGLLPFINGKSHN